jgi:hypothetical protein
MPEYYCPECERDLSDAVRLFGEMALDIHKQCHQRDRIRKALEPFLKPQFSEGLGGNVEGDDSPIYERNGAKLTIFDFRRLREIFDE